MKREKPWKCAKIQRPSQSWSGARMLEQSEMTSWQRSIYPESD